MLVRDAMHTTTVTIDVQDSLPQAALMMQTLGVRRLLVLSEDKVVGLVTEGEVRRALLHRPLLYRPLDSPPAGSQQPWREEGPQEAVSAADRTDLSQIMRRQVFTARPDDDLRQAVRTMLERHIGGLPVLCQDGSLVGILTLTDVLRAAAHPQPGQGQGRSGQEASGQHPEDWGNPADWGTVRQHMAGEAVTVSPDTPLAEAAARLVGTRLRVLPVTQGRTLLGVLHRQDIREAVARQEASHSTELVGSEVADSVLHGSVLHGPVLYGAVLPGTADTNDFFFLQSRTVRDLMCPPSAKILADAPLLEAIGAMLDADVHGLPVVEGKTADNGTNEFLGVITVSDVLRALLTRGAADRQLQQGGTCLS